MSDTPEERTYYLRSILMYMDLTKETILKVFRYLIKCEDIANFLESVDIKKKLKDLFKNKSLKKTEYNLVSYRPNPDKFDIALLIKLIFGLCKNEIASPHLGWKAKPDPKDESLGADLIRLRNVRNTLIGHRADAKLSKAEYEKTRDKVQAILIRVIKNVDPSSKEDIERRIDEYTKLVVDTENTRVKTYLDQLLEYKNEYDILQDMAEEESKRSREFQVYFKTTPERYVRYIKLLFDGGRLVLGGILERELDKHGSSLVSLISNNREILESMVDKQYESHLFPLEPGKMDHTKWDVDLLASLILLVLPNISLDESSKIELIKDSRLCYAKNALRSLDADDFLSVLTDLISSLNFLSMNIAEEKKLEVWSLIERYKKKNDDGDADEYLGQLRKSGMLVKTLRDIHEETVVRLKQSLRLLDETGINFKAEHDLELKILTTCQNEEKKKDAEEYLERNLHASINESDRPANLIRKETDKLVASISIHPDVKPTGVKRSCVLLSFRSSSPSGLIHILDYCGSHHFKARLHNIAKELHFLFEDAFLLQGHVTLESLFRETQNVDNTEDESHKGLSIPLKCSSVDGMRYVLDTLKNEKTTNRLNIIAEKISMELKETVSINMTPDLLEFRDVFDETDSEGSGSDGIIVDEVDKAEDKYSTEKELKLQKLDTNRKEFEHSPTICTDETVKSTCEKEEDSTLLRDSEGSDSGGIDADKVGKAGKRYSSAKERENQKLDADRKAAKHPLAICTDETEKSKCDQEEDSTLLPDSEGAGSGGTDADKADKLEDRYSSKKERDNQNLDTNKKAAEHPQTIWTDESEESTSGDENDLDFYLDSEGTDSGGADLDKADKAEDKYLSAKEWKNQELDAVEHSPIIWKDVIEGSTHEQEKDSTLLLGQTDVYAIGSSVQDLKKYKQRRLEDTIPADILYSHPFLIRSDVKRTAVQYLMEGLQEFVDEISKQDFTVMLSTIQKKYQAKYCNGCSLRTLLPAHTSISVMCPLGQKNCNCIDIVGKKPCPSHFCDAMYDEITKRHRYSEPSWWNSNVEKWFQEHWEIAKCFIRYRDTYMGYRDTCMLEMSAAETSTEGLLDVIINNKELQNSVCCEIDPPSDIFSQTRTFISNEDVTDDYKLRTNIDHMISILTDGKYIYRKPAAQKAVRNLLKLRKRVFEKRDFSSFPNPVYDPQTYEGQSLFEDKNWLYPSQHQSIHCSPTDTLDVNVQYTDTALTATGLGEKHDEEETVWSKSKHSEAVKYPSGFHSLRTEHLDISQDTSSETKFNELLLEASKSCKTMEDDSSKISEKDLLCLQSKIEYLSQALETIQTSNIDTTEPLQSDKAKEQVMMFQKEFKSLKDLQKKFVDIKTKFLREIIMKDWQYKAKKEDLRNYLIRQYNRKLCKYKWRYFGLRQLKPENGAFIHSFSDIFYQNNRKCENVYVEDRNRIYNNFCEHLVNSWCNTYSRKYGLGEYDLDEPDDALKEFEFVFMISLRDTEAEVQIYEMITNQFHLEGEHFSIFEQVLFRESEKCLIILQQPNDEMREAKIPLAENIRNKQLPPRRPMHDVVVLTTIQSELNLKLGSSDKLLSMSLIV